MATLRSGDLDGLHQLLSSGADLNSPGRKISLSDLEPQVPSYPLIWTIDMGKREAVRLLLDNGADPNICCEYVDESQACWLKPLCHASDPDIVTMLLDAGAEVNALHRSRTGTETALLKAACNEPSVGEPLIKRGADVNITDERGRTALYQAILYGHHKLAACLIRVRWIITIHSASDSRFFMSDWWVLVGNCSFVRKKLVWNLTRSGQSVRNMIVAKHWQIIFI